MGDSGSIANSSCSHPLSLRLQGIFNVKPLVRFYQCRNKTALLRVVLEEDERELLIELHRIRPLLAVFVCLIVIGAIGNALLVYVVARRARMRTVTNVLVLNLAVSDFVLCTVTQPCNIRRLFFHNYSWKSGPALCKIVNALTGVNLFVSTFSVTAIALDRCRVVLQSMPSGPAGSLCRLALLAIWVAAFLVASPMLWFAEIAKDETRLSGAHTVCAERSGSQTEKALKVAYSGVTMCLQYAIPLAVLLCAFVRIRARLARRLRTGPLSCCSQTPLQLMRQRIEQRRQRRTNALLVAVAVLFGLSWLPLSAFNLFHDVKLWQINVYNHMSFAEAEGRIGGADLGFSALTAQGLCLLSVLASACINPLLYGFFNENFRCELRDLLCSCKRRWQQWRPRGKSQGQEEEEDVSERPQVMESRV